MIVDASVVLRAFFPAEHQSHAQALIRGHVSGQVQLNAPTILLYELTHAVWQAERRGRISGTDAEAILTAFEGLGIALEAVSWRQVLAVARRFNRSAYDAVYLALAEARGEPLVTADLRLYRSVHEQLEWVQWLGDVTATMDPLDPTADNGEESNA
jgi:predicted nucleic acid-binding protein